MTTQFQDPWDSAEKPETKEYSSQYWGFVEASAWYCVLEKGIGRVVYDPQRHSQDQRRTAVDILVRPIPEMGLQFDISRSMLAESREWAQVVLPSIRDLGLSPREINGKWAKVELVPVPGKNGTAETYTDSSGVIKERKTIRFLAVFESEESCRADYFANKGQSSPNTQYEEGDGNGNGNKERETALKFLKVYVQNACRGKTDLEAIRNALAPQIASQPLISKYFTVDSPETLQLIAEEVTKHV